MIQYRGSVLNYEEALRWFEERRYKTRPHRTLYHNYLKVIQPDDLNLGIYYTRLKNVQCISEEQTVALPNGTSLALRIGDTFWSARWRIKAPYSSRDWVQSESFLRDWFYDNTDITGVFKDLSEERFKSFYSDGLMIGWDMSAPWIYYRPDGSTVIGGSLPTISQGLNNLFSGYIGKKILSDTRPYLRWTNGILTARHKNQNLVVTKHSGDVQLRGTVCWQCKNARHIPSACTPNSSNNIGINKHNKYICRHGYAETHEDWTNLTKCSNCEGDPLKRGRRVYTGFVWTGMPIMLDADNNVIDSLVPNDATQASPVRKYQKYRLYDLHLGIGENES